jgi:hypothetical protein
LNICSSINISKVLLDAFYGGLPYGGVIKEPEMVGLLVGLLVFLENLEMRQL